MEKNVVFDKTYKTGFRDGLKKFREYMAGITPPSQWDSFLTIDIAIKAVLKKEGIEDD